MSPEQKIGLLLEEIRLIVGPDLANEHKIKLVAFDLSARITPQIDLEALLTDSTSVQIDSGQENRCKLLYRHPDILYRNLASQGLELRCAD